MSKRTGDQVALEEYKQDFTEEFRQVLIVANELRRNIERLAGMYSRACRNLEATRPDLLEDGLAASTGLNAATVALLDMAGTLHGAIG